MKEFTLNASIATIVNFSNIGLEEIVPITFTADEPWPQDSLNVEVWNSAKKNQSLHQSVITKSDDRVMEWVLTPKGFMTIADTVYYEISGIEDGARILFKGQLEIKP